VHVCVGVLLVRLFVCVFTLWCQTRVYSTVEQTKYSYCVSKIRGVYVLVFVGCGSKKARVVFYPSGVVFYPSGVQ
jgi:hypothetical protein